jgi:hypothetical protein
LIHIVVSCKRTMTRLHNVASLVMALISVGLYSALAVTCFYFANKFWDRESKRLKQGRYVAAKFSFFIVLGISAIMDLPTFVTCAAKGGPENCEWGTKSSDFCWCMHLLATIGQQYAIITPMILWSDIIFHRDGNFLITSSPLDAVKLFFRIVWVLYCGVIGMTILGVILDPDSQETTQVSDCLMPIMLFLMTSGCLFTGIRLQQHVIKVHLATDTQMRFLLQLNFLMLFITCSYALRAVMVLSLFGPMPDAYQRAFDVVGAYALWLPLTQWLPFVFCSFCLVHNMRFKGAGTTNRKSTESTDSTASRGIGMATIMESGLQMGEPSMSDRGTDASTGEVLSPFEHPSHHTSRSTDVSVDGYQSRSISYLLTRLHAQQEAGQSVTARLHQEDQLRPHRHTDADTDAGPDPRQSDMYSAFGGDRDYSQEGLDTFRDSAMSTASSVATGTDNFFGASALQRATSPGSHAPR